MAAATETIPRRQSSTTSLSKYIRAEPSLEQRSLDFCNAFWGLGDGGVDVLLARMRGAMRTIEEVKAFYKERVAIEEEYARKLNKLAKMNVGRDEIGELRNSIDTLRLETDKQASSHLALAQSIRADCEVPVTEFAGKAASHRKNYTSAVERFFKNKQTQEGYVAKAREKYEQDCNRINFCTAKLSIEQGKELEKTQIKLERAKSSVVSSEKEYQNFVRALKDTWSRWEKEWKGYCDRCQDMEEERIGFLKDNIWSYANSVSTVCVSDDESCEKLRVALEQLETEKDMENFVRDYGTGQLIPEPPPFIDYSAADPRPPPTKPRHANFARSTMRAVGIMIPQDRTPIEDEDAQSQGNAAGVGAVGLRRDSAPTSPAPDRIQSRSSSRARVVLPSGSIPSRPTSVINPSPPSVDVLSSSSSSQPIATAKTAPPLASEFRPIRDPHAPPVDPTSETMIKIGDRAYPADPNKDPQTSLGRRPTSRVPPPSIRPERDSVIGGHEDPLLRQMNELQKEGSVRRNVSHQGGRPTSKPQQVPTPSSTGSANVTSGSQPLSPASTGLVPPGSRTSIDYHSAAEALVGAHPSSRPTSPANPLASPPMAKHMQPPPASPSSPNLPVEEVISNYQQRLPGERPSSVRSRRDSHIEVPPASIHRPSSREGHVGIGAHGRASPQPIQVRPISRGPSPQPIPNGTGAPYTNPPQISSPAGTSPGPGSVGIRLDSQGRVIQDSLAYGGPQAYGAPPPQQQQPPPQQQQQQQHPDPRASTYGRPPMMQQQQPQPQRAQQPINQPGYSSAQQIPQQMPPQVSTQIPTQIPSQIPSQIPPGVVRAPSVHRSPSPQPGYVPPQGYNRGSWQNGPSPQQYAPPGGMHVVQQPPRINTDVGPSVHRQSTLYNNAPPANRYGGPAQQVAQPSQLQRHPSYGYVANAGPVQPQQQPPQQPVYGHNNYGGSVGYANGMQRNYAGYGPGPDYRGASQQMQRSPSPQPQPQASQSSYQDEPKILFYVKALYDYRASVEEEFDFQANDIIAVTSTPDDGWWTGILLDESRRVPGRNVFPSNFVTFF